MIKKTIYGLITALIAIAVLIFNNEIPLLLNMMVAIVSAFGVRELFVAMDIEKKAFVFIIPTVIFVVLFAFIYDSKLLIILWYLYTILIFGFMICFRKLIAFKNVAVIYSITLLISFSLKSFILMRDMSKDFGTFYILISLCIPCLADTGAYFCGSFFGKNKLCEDISPKKTVEGAIGGVLLSIVCTVVLSLVCNILFFKYTVEINYFYLVIMSFVGSLIAIIGDLCFSMVKRGCHVKDFGNMIPGHGGVLDRIDSIIFISPFIYLMFNFFSIIKFV